MVLGAFGAAAYSDIGRILNYNVIISVGFLAFGLAVSSKEALDGVVFYLLHDMVAKALLFIIGGMLMYIAGTGRLKEMGGLIKRYPFMGWMFFITALAIAGIPPLSGFTGKLLIIMGGFQEKYFWLTAVSLASSFIVLYSLIKIFMAAFWGAEMKNVDSLPAVNKGFIVSTAGLCLIVVAMGIGSEWVYQYVSEAGHTLINPAQYINAVLKE